MKKAKTTFIVRWFRIFIFYLSTSKVKHLIPLHIREQVKFYSLFTPVEYYEGYTPYLSKDSWESFLKGDKILFFNINDIESYSYKIYSNGDIVRDYNYSFIRDLSRREYLVMEPLSDSSNSSFMGKNLNK